MINFFLTNTKKTNTSMLIDEAQSVNAKSQLITHDFSAPGIVCISIHRHKTRQVKLPQHEYKYYLQSKIRIE